MVYFTLSCSNHSKIYSHKTIFINCFKSKRQVLFFSTKVYFIKGMDKKFTLIIATKSKKGK